MKYFQLKDRQDSGTLGASLISLSVPSLIHPGFYFILKFILPDAQDSYGERLLYCMPALAGFFALLFFKKIRPYSQTILGVSASFVFVNLFILLVRNNLDPVYCTGFYVTASCALAIMLHLPALLLVTSYIIVGSAWVALTTQNPIMNPLWFFSLAVLEASLATLVNAQKLKGYLQIEKQKQRLLESERLASLGILAAGVAHEINNPLTIINLKASMSLQKLEKSDLTKEQVVSTLKSIQDGVMRASAVIKNLNSFADQARAEIQQEFTLINDAFENAKKLYASRIAIAGIKISVQGEKGACVEVGLIQLTQIFATLLSNAIDAVELLSTENRWIEFRIREDSQSFQVSVVDAGANLPASVVENIFVPFFTTKGPSGGSGMSLSLAKVSIERLGGALRYVPNVKNTEFELTIPSSKRKT